MPSSSWCTQKHHTTMENTSTPLPRARPASLFTGKACRLPPFTPTTLGHRGHPWQGPKMLLRTSSIGNWTSGQLPDQELHAPTLPSLTQLAKTPLGTCPPLPCQNSVPRRRLRPTPQRTRQSLNGRDHKHTAPLTVGLLQQSSQVPQSILHLPTYTLRRKNYPPYTPHNKQHNTQYNAIPTRGSHCQRLQSMGLHVETHHLTLFYTSEPPRPFLETTLHPHLLDNQSKWFKLSTHITTRQYHLLTI